MSVLMVFKKYIHTVVVKAVAFIFLPNSETLGKKFVLGRLRNLG